MGSQLGTFILEEVQLNHDKTWLLNHQQSE